MKWNLVNIKYTKDELTTN